MGLPRFYVHGYLTSKEHEIAHIAKMNVIFVDKELQINMLSLEFVVYLFQNMKHVSINNMAFLNSSLVKYCNILTP